MVVVQAFLSIVIILQNLLYKPFLLFFWWDLWYTETDKSMFVEVIDMANRFEFVENNGLMQGTRIIVDKETGVQYLLAHWTNVGGLTVLVDKDGKPLLDPRYAK